MVSLPPLPKILTPQRQLVVLQVGQQLLQLHEESLTRFVAIGIHVEWSIQVIGKRCEPVHIPLVEQRGRRYGYCLVTRREHRPAVAAPLGDVERFAGFEHLQHGQVVDGALGSVGEAEAGRGRSLPNPSEGGAFGCKGFISFDLPNSSVGGAFDSKCFSILPSFGGAGGGFTPSFFQLSSFFTTFAMQKYEN